MRSLALAPMGRLAGLAPLVVRLVAGVIMAAHGLQKRLAGPAGFGQAQRELTDSDLLSLMTHGHLARALRTVTFATLLAEIQVRHQL